MYIDNRENYTIIDNYTTKSKETEAREWRKKRLLEKE